MNVPDSDRAAAAPAPPPGCPAHAFTGEADLIRLYGSEYTEDSSGVIEALRATHGSMAPVLLTGDVPAWLVLGYRENLEVVRTPARFSRDPRGWRELKEGRVPADSPLLPLIGWRPDCVSADGEEHRRLRDAVNDSLARFDRRGIRRHVTRFSNQLIDGFSADGRADLVGQFAEQLPMIVLAELLGMPEEYGPRLVSAAQELVKGSAKAVKGNEYIRETLRQLVARRHAEPASDLTSWLIEHPAELTDEEVLNHLWLVLIAANENTTVLMGNTLRMVLSDDRFRASLNGIRMTLADAVEHVLWNEPPTMVLPARWATNDMEFAGHRIEKGDMLLLGLAAGNVDPQIRPNLAAPMYGNRSHLAFSGGPHECPGQDIGRAITDTAIDALLMRLPDLQLGVPDEELTWRASTFTRRLVELPVLFSPRKPEPEPEAEAPGGRVESTGGPPPATAAQTEPAGPAPATARPSRWRSLTRWFRRR